MKNELENVQEQPAKNRKAMAMDNLKVVMLKSNKTENRGYQNKSQAVGDDNDHVDGNDNAGAHAHNDDVDNGHGDDNEFHGRDDGHLGNNKDGAN